MKQIDHIVPSTVWNSTNTPHSVCKCTDVYTFSWVKLIGKYGFHVNSKTGELCCTQPLYFAVNISKVGASRHFFLSKFPFFFFTSFLYSYWQQKASFVLTNFSWACKVSLDDITIESWDWDYIWRLIGVCHLCLCVRFSFKMLQLQAIKAFKVKEM